MVCSLQAGLHTDGYTSGAIWVDEGAKLEFMRVQSCMRQIGKASRPLSVASQLPGRPHASDVFQRWAELCPRQHTVTKRSTHSRSFNAPVLARNSATPDHFLSPIHVLNPRSAVISAIRTDWVLLKKKKKKIPVLSSCQAWSVTRLTLPGLSGPPPVCCYGDGRWVTNPHFLRAAWCSWPFILLFVMKAVWVMSSFLFVRQ